MGGFALCIEKATRDIHSLLTLHRVHPQVHADVQRILGSLLRKQYTSMTVHYSPDTADSPEQVCRALVRNIIDKTVSTAIPAADIQALEKRSARLEEDRELLVAEAVRAEKQLAELQAVLRNLKDAHDYMLHSYFREVLMLRSRIDDLQRQNRSYRAHAAASPSAHAGSSAAFASTMGSQLQQFVFSHAGGNGGNLSRDGTTAAATGKRIGADEVSGFEAAAASEGSAPSPSSAALRREGKSEGADTASAGPSPTRGLSETRRGLGHDESGGDGYMRVAATPASKPSATRGMSPSPRGKDRSVRIASPMGSSSPGRQTMTMQTTTTYEVVPAAEPESVDAIFDYEEYVRRLNGERGSWAKRFVAVMTEPDGGARRRRRSLKFRTRTFSDVVLRGSDGGGQGTELAHDHADDEEEQQQQAKRKGFQWLLHLALEPVQHQLRTELSQLRQAVCTMQKEHARDVQALSRALVHVQSRNDGLLDFLETFVQETKRTVAVLARDSRAQTVTDLLSSGALPVEKADTVSTFFSRSPSTSVGVLSPATAPAPPPPLTQLAEMVGLPPSKASGSDAPSRSVSSHALHPRKEWRLKPDARLSAETRSAAMKAMDRRLQRPDASKSSTATSATPEVNNPSNYYRADLGLPYWSAHPITSYAQEVFGELQLVAKEMRVTRVQQLYAFEEAVSVRGESGRRVRFDRAGGSSASVEAESKGSVSRRRRNGSLNASMDKTPESFYGLGEEGEAGARPHKHLREGWRSRPVVDGDSATAGDLLRELVSLRMRRACDQVRLARAQDTIVYAFHPELAAEEDDMTAMWTKRGKPGSTAAAGKRKPSEMPPINFTSPEEVLKHRALQNVSSNTQKRIGKASQRIAELQRLLTLFFAENEEQEVMDYAGIEAARQTAEEEAAGLYRVNGELRSAAELWNSPYLNDAGGRGGQVLYLPIGLETTRDAEGNVGGGAGACVMLGDTEISVAPYRVSASSTAAAAKAVRAQGLMTADGGLATQGIEGAEVDDGDDGDGVAELPNNTPYIAVMDYCRGVQLGRPVGRRGGPVYLFQDPSSGAYYVGDAEGRPAFTAARQSTEANWLDSEVGGDTSPVGSPAGSGGRRPPLAMTRILFPAPLPTTATATPSHVADDADAVATSPVPSMALQPLYLVPMAIPLSEKDAAIREGWQACHRHGHTRQDPIFTPTMSPLPLSTSYHHVVPQRTAGTAAGMHDRGNKYVSDPPRVFRPADEASSMVRVGAVQLQDRKEVGAADVAPSASPLPYFMDGGASATSSGGGPGLTLKGNAHSASALRNTTSNTGMAGAPSESSNPGVTVSPAETAFTAPTATTTPPPSLLRAPLLSSGSLPASPRPLEPLWGLASTPETAAVVAAFAVSGETLGSAARSGAAFAATTPAPTSCSYSAATTTTTGTSMTAAVLLAKQQRAARLAKEAEVASHAKAQRQEAWQQRSETRVPTEKEAFLRLPHLTPLPTRGSENSAMLPAAASSARLQRQMRPEKLALAPPPPSSSRRTESAKRSSSEWDLDKDA